MNEEEEEVDEEEEEEEDGEEDGERENEGGRRSIICRVDFCRSNSDESTEKCSNGIKRVTTSKEKNLFLFVLRGTRSSQFPFLSSGIYENRALNFLSTSSIAYCIFITHVRYCPIK